MEMETFKMKYKLIWRWSVFSAGLISLYWMSWYLINGEIPVISQITWGHFNGEHDIFQIANRLPISASRWWDILIGPIVCFILIGGTIDTAATDDKMRRRAYISSAIIAPLIGLSLTAICGYLYFINPHRVYELHYNFALIVACWGTLTAVSICALQFADPPKSRVRLIETMLASFAINLLVAGLFFGFIAGLCYGAIGFIITLLAYIFLTFAILVTKIFYSWLTLKS